MYSQLGVHFTQFLPSFRFSVGIILSPCNELCARCVGIISGRCAGPVGIYVGSLWGIMWLYRWKVCPASYILGFCGELYANYVGYIGRLCVWIMRILYGVCGTCVGMFRW